MKPTLEQLNELSDYEINCAVFNKIAEYKSDGRTYPLPEPCTDPRDYMPIAIDHGIDINFGESGEVWCDWGEPAVDITPPRAKEQTGRAVCIAFLLMEIDK